MNSRLPNSKIRHLKALAQRMEPLAKVGKAGLSEPFLMSLNETLDQHELVKVKFGELKEQKKELAPVVAEKTSSHLIMQVGNVIVLYREQPDPARRKIHFPK
jgi:RNA-binding protein